jgi:WD40 repeat protein/serine/threonine protein kinase
MKMMTFQNEDLLELHHACAELRARIRAGESWRVEDILTSHSTLAANDEAILELIHAEVSTRSDLGERPTLDEWQDRFPRLIARMEEIVELRGVFGTEMPTLSDCTVGQREPVGIDNSPEARPPRIGNYQILEEIGRGGMGVVYKARQTTLSRIVALKMILAGEHAGLRERSRLRNEAEAAAQLLHPNVVQIFEIGEHEGLPFLAMEYVPGGNLNRMLRAKPQAFRWSAKLTETLARTIHVAHQRGIVHRDLNPSNILMAPDGTPKISDFGLAKFLLDNNGVSLNGLILGTPPYMAPEQVSRNGRSIGAGTDVYALGALLYEMLTGTPPFRGLTPMETLCQVLEGELVPPSKLRHGLPEDLETICLKCLEKDPVRRYSTADDLAADLQRFQENQPILARRTSKLRQAWQWTCRQPLAASLLGVSLLLFLTLLTVVLGYSIHLTEVNLRLEHESSQAMSANTIIRINQDKFEREVQDTARRQWYDAKLNQVKQALEAGQIELAQELFEGVRAELKPRDRLGFEWHYLDRLIQQACRSLQAHDADITCMSVCHRANVLVSGDRGGKVVIWDLAKSTSLVCRGGHHGPVELVAIAGGEAERPATVATLARGADGAPELKLWNAGTGSVLAAIRPGQVVGSHLTFSPDGNHLTLCGTSREHPASCSWTWRLGASVWRLLPELCIPEATTLAYSPDSALLALGGSNGSIQLLGLADGKPRSIEQCPGGRVLSLSFSCDGTRLAAGRNDQADTVWDAKTGRILAHRTDHEGPVVYVGFCLDDKSLVGCDDKYVLWTRRLDRAGPRRLLQRLERPVSSFSLSPDGRLLAAAGRDQPVTIWNLALGSREGSYQANSRVVRQVAFAPDGQSLLIDSQHRDVRRWRYHESQDLPQVLQGHDKEAWTLAFSPDGSLLASGSDDNTIKIWDVETGRELLTLKGHDKTVTCLAFFPELDRIASVSLDGRLILWELSREETGTEKISARKTVLHSGPDPLRALAISPDRQHMAVAGTQGTIRVWNLETKAFESQLQAHTRSVHALAYSQNPGVLASASADQTVRLWNPQTGLLKTESFSDGMRTLGFSSDGGLMAAGGDPRVVSLWSMDLWTTKMVFTGHPLPVRAVAFSPDQRIIATACDDKKVRCWDVATGQLIFALHGHLDRVNAVVFSPDTAPENVTLASCDHLGRVCLWRSGNPQSAAPATRK